MAEHICPISQKSVGEQCSNWRCPFNSPRLENGCWHGSELNIADYAWYKHKKPAEVKNELDTVESNILHALKILNFAQFCSDAKPSRKDKEIWAKLRFSFPYNLKALKWIDERRFARMRQRDAFEAFKATGVEIEGNLKTFLTTQPL